jgi:hypothetical protein
MGVAPLAYGVTLYIDAVRVFAAWAVRGMCSEALYYIALIIASGEADGVGGRNELDDAARHLGWCAGRRDVVLALSPASILATTTGDVLGHPIHVWRNALYDITPTGGPN